ncbi:MAG TPA: HlyD family efflux transporter periplasmic adaptor subunit [Patescibacteria group bacterium]|nr:HlyD family efflux transporter periplasmic adaptor subunit [Patescibacteria group bacterium]
MSASFDGEVKARIIELRFAESGKIAHVSKHTGDLVKKGNLVASLDRKMLQIELDRQLNDFEKVRADFERFAEKHPDPQDENKFIKAEKQAQLNASVKDVELTKAKLDQADLFAPIDGIILDDSNILPGIYVSPASSAVKLIDTGAYYFEFEIKQKNIHDFMETRKCVVKIDMAPENIEAKTGTIVPDGKKFVVRVALPENKWVLLGMRGICKF